MKSPKGKKTGNGAEPASFPLRVPHVGIKEGVLYDLVDQFVSGQDHEERREREVLTSAVTVDRKISLRFLGEEQPIEKGRHDGD